jgi:hypothetical protein
MRPAPLHLEVVAVGAAAQEEVGQAAVDAGRAAAGPREAQVQQHRHVCGRHDAVDEVGLVGKVVDPHLAARRQRAHDDAEAARAAARRVSRQQLLQPRLDDAPPHADEPQGALPDAVRQRQRVRRLGDGLGGHAAARERRAQRAARRAAHGHAREVEAAREVLHHAQLPPGGGGEGGGVAGRRPPRAQGAQAGAPLGARPAAASSAPVPKSTSAAGGPNPAPPPLACAPPPPHHPPPPTPPPPTAPAAHQK